LADVKPIQAVGVTANLIVAKVWQLAEPLCRSEGMELVFVEYQRETSGWILRIFIDKADGVTLDDCVNISRQIGDLLDVSLETESRYRLEVSSPGLPRPLGKIGDFERYKGGQAKIKMVQSINGQKNFLGVLDGVSGQTIRLMVDDQAIAIALDDIKKAHLINFNGES
jgi:ribosome maturation factor RimP